MLLSGHFLGIVSLVFSKVWHGARNPYEVVHDRAGFSKRKILLSKLGKWTKNGPKIGLFEAFEKLDQSFLRNLFYNKNIYFLLCSCTNTMFEKTFVPEVWGKMFSTNQFVVIFNQPYL